MQFGEVSHILEAGENEDAELGETGMGRPASALASILGAMGSHRRFHTGSGMGRTKITLAVGFSEEVAQVTLAQPLLRPVESTHQLTVQQIFNEHWLCVRFSAVCWGYSRSRANRGPVLTELSVWGEGDRRAADGLCPVWSVL